MSAARRYPTGEQPRWGFAGAKPPQVWTRDTWAELADGLLRAVRPHASPGNAQIVLPGEPGGYGGAADGLEGFARTFLIAAFRLAGEDGHDAEDNAEWYAAGIAAGTDPASADRWLRPDEHPQAKVEAASIALALDLTRPWIWDRLDGRVRERVVEYLSPVVGDGTYPRINWVWFRIVVETFLRSVGGPWSAEDIAADLEAHDSFYRGDGWFADGAERSYDHYGGWALHLYPILWARMAGARDDLAERRGGVDAARLSRFVRDHLRLIGLDGSPLIQGRSLTYRFAAAAPLWVAAVAGTDVPPGRLRHAASAMVSHFTSQGAPDERGLLTLGWHHEWRPIAQRYSGPGSPYWAAKGLLGLMLPPSHPVWTAPDEPLPGETDDQLWVAGPPGWLVSGTKDDGIVRVVNHGTDHAGPGAQLSDSPLYARLGYSTATAPLLSERSWAEPLDQAVVLLDTDGNATHRTGMRLLRAETVGAGAGEALVGASVVRAHWVAIDPGQPDHGSGRSGTVRDAAEITTVSVVRGAWELRCVWIDPLADLPDAIRAATRLRLGGWPVARSGEPPAEVPVASGLAVRVAADRATSRRAGGEEIVSSVVAVTGFDTASVHDEDGASPLGEHTATPWVAGPVVPGRWYVAAVGLGGSVDPDAAPGVLLDGGIARVRWPGGGRTTFDLGGLRADGASRQAAVPRPGPHGAGHHERVNS